MGGVGGALIRVQGLREGTMKGIRKIEESRGNEGLFFSVVG